MLFITRFMDTADASPHLQVFLMHAREGMRAKAAEVAAMEARLLSATHQLTQLTNHANSGLLRIILEAYMHCNY